MDVRYVNPFINAIRHVLKTMLDVEVFVGKPSIKSSDAPSSDVSAIIGFSGKATGSIALCLSQSTAVRLASRFARAELSIYDVVPLADALGELTNIVAGQAKAHLPNVPVTISLPRVIVGTDHRLVESVVSPILFLPCDSSIGRFSVEVMMEVRKACPFVTTVNTEHQDDQAAPPLPVTKKAKRHHLEQPDRTPVPLD